MLLEAQEKCDAAAWLWSVLLNQLPSGQESRGQRIESTKQALSSV